MNLIKNCWNKKLASNWFGPKKNLKVGGKRTYVANKTTVVLQLNCPEEWDYCPFCGGDELEIWIEKEKFDFTPVKVCCEGCGICVHFGSFAEGFSQEEILHHVLLRWNTRVQK